MEWSSLNSDPEVLQRIKGMHINITSSLPNANSFQYSFNEVETELLRQEIENFIGKRVIAHTICEPGELILTIFVKPKTDSRMKLIFNLKSLNKLVRYKKFKMDTISSILHLIRPNMFLAKLKLKFQKKFLALAKGYIERARKFTKLLKLPLSRLRI